MLHQIYKFLITTLVVLFSINIGCAKEDAHKVFTVVIDAGHGGKDIGATDNGVMEKNINLKVAKQLESLIKKKLKDTKVVMTRDGDTFLSLQERAEKANKAQGDIFISIHTNSVDKRNKNRKNLAGSSVYTLGLHKDENNLEVARRENSVIEFEQDYQQKYSGFDPQRDESYIIFEMVQKKNLSQSIQLADIIEKELEKSGRQNRGVHQAGFWVLWATSMPSVLVELDFICNPLSAKYLSSDKGSKELAEAIFKAVQKYESTWKKAQISENKETNIINHNDNQDLVGLNNEVLESTTNDYFMVDSPSNVIKPKTRTHKEIKIKQTSVRRRRSETAKQLSLNNIYEADNLVYPSKKTFDSNIKDIDKGEILLAGVSEKENNKEKNKKVNKKKKEEKKSSSKPNKRKTDAYNARVNKLVTVYKIQLLSSSDLLYQSNSLFCGLSPITTYKENNLYKYYYGESTDKSELEAVLADIKEKIPDAFIVSSTKSVQTNK